MISHSHKLNSCSLYRNCLLNFKTAISSKCTSFPWEMVHIERISFSVCVCVSNISHFARIAVKQTVPFTCAKPALILWIFHQLFYSSNLQHWQKHSFPRNSFRFLLSKYILCFIWYSEIRCLEWHSKKTFLIHANRWNTTAYQEKSCTFKKTLLKRRPWAKTKTTKSTLFAMYE